MESADYYAKTAKKERSQQLSGPDAWEKASKSVLDFTKRPVISYTFGDDIEVEPVYFENVKILWRAQEEVVPVEGTHDPETGEQLLELPDPSTAETVAVFPSSKEHAPTPTWVQDLKSMIAWKLPQFSQEFLNENYDMLIHPLADKNKCRYNPFGLPQDKYQLETYGIHDHELPEEEEQGSADHFYRHTVEGEDENP